MAVSKTSRPTAGNSFGTRQSTSMHRLTEIPAEVLAEFRTACIELSEMICIDQVLLGPIISNNSENSTLNQLWVCILTECRYAATVALPVYCGAVTLFC